jgi:DNA polymerase I-like protein with 3'-5' exonuclease and polymerase domains
MIIACIHDEIILEAPVDKGDAASRILRESMIEAGQHYLKSVPVGVDVKVVDNWAEK